MLYKTAYFYYKHLNFSLDTVQNACAQKYAVNLVRTLLKKYIICWLS